MLPLGELVVSEYTATNSYAHTPPTKHVFKHRVYPQRDSQWQAVVSVEQWCRQKVWKGHASVLSAAIKTPYMQLIQSLECNRLNALQHCRLSTPIQGICLQCLAEQSFLSSNTCQIHKLYISFSIHILHYQNENIICINVVSKKACAFLNTPLDDAVICMG